MTSPVSAVLLTLQDVLDTLTGDIPTDDCAIVPGVCLANLYPSADSVAWDACGEGCSDGGDGQLWAALASLDTVDQGAGACARVTWSAVVGIVRCVTGLREDGTQSPEAVERDALQQAADADAIWRALTCCPDRPETIRDVSLLTWESMGPSGGCVGGQWTITGVLDDCCESPPVHPRTRYC